MTEAESKEGREGGEHWSTTPERRGMWGLRLLWLLYRIGGRPLFALIGTPVAFIFRLTGTRAREASDRFLERVAERREALGLVLRPVSGHAHFRAFATSMLDRLAAWAGDLKLARDVDFADEESRRLLCEPTPDGRGRLVLVSHLGVAEATRALAQHDRAVPVWALIFDRHAPRFKAMLEAVAPDASRHVIAVDRLGVETASMLQDAIERGEWVAIAADRTPNDALTRGDRSVTADFLGREAPFPAGPFILASLLKCGVVTLFAVREGNRILIKCEPFTDEVKLPRRGREAELSRLASLWAQRLEAEALEHPAQWFNFYDFWHEEDLR